MLGINVIGNDDLTVSTTAVSLATHKDGLKCMSAEVQVQDDEIYFTRDGSTPTASNGMLGEVGAVLSLNSFFQVKNFRAIRVTTDAVIHVDYSCDMY